MALLLFGRFRSGTLASLAVLPSKIPEAVSLKDINPCREKIADASSFTVSDSGFGGCDVPTLFRLEMNFFLTETFAFSERGSLLASGFATTEAPDPELGAVTNPVGPPLEATGSKLLMNNLRLSDMA